MKHSRQRIPLTSGAGPGVKGDVRSPRRTAQAGGPRRLPRARALRGLAVATAVGAVLGAGACSSTPVQPRSPAQPSAAAHPNPAAPAGAACPYSDSAARQMGTRLWDIAKAQIADSYTDQFRDLRAVLLSVCGKPVLQHYEKTTPASYHMVASVTKSVVGTLVGIALADGSLRDPNQTLAELLPERRKDMSAEVATITLRQLLTMTAGLDADSSDDSVKSWQDTRDFVGAILREGLQQPKGEFHYSTASSHLLAAILVHATGRPLLEYARAKLFDPLGIETRPATELRLGPASAASLAASAAAYDRAGFTWPVDPQGVNFGGGFLKLKPTDLLRLGQLYLDQGRVGSRQIVPARWVQEATTTQVSTNGGFGGDGYGYQWWITKAGPEKAYAAVGFGGQLIEVVPSRHLVAVFATEVLLTGDHVFRVDSRPYASMVARLLARTADTASAPPSGTGSAPGN